MRASLFLSLLLVVGCDHKGTTPGDRPGARGTILVPPGRDIPSGSDDKKVADDLLGGPVNVMKQEEARLAGLRDEFRRLPAADQAFVREMEAKMSRRPVEDFVGDELVKLRRLGKYISSITRQGHLVALAESFGAGRLSILLKLIGLDANRFHMEFAVEPPEIRAALATAIEKAAAGLSNLDDGSRALLKERGYAEYLGNLPD